MLYPPKVGSGFKGALAASVAGLSLTHTVGKAVWAGLLTSGKPFLRTPKCEDPALFSQVLRVIWQEATLLVLLIAAMILLVFALIATSRLEGPYCSFPAPDPGPPRLMA